jgi:hypothetical protein
MRLAIAMAVCLRCTYAFRPMAGASGSTMQFSLSAKTCALRAAAARSSSTRTWSVREKTENQYEKIWDRVAVETRGDEAIAKELVEGMRLQWAFGFPNTPAGMSQLTHGSHYYPAGMQPAMAKHLLETVLPGDSLLGEAAFSKVMYCTALLSARTALTAMLATLHKHAFQMQRQLSTAMLTALNTSVAAVCHRSFHWRRHSAYRRAESRP